MQNFLKADQNARQVVAQGQVAARAKLQAVPLGMCKVEDHSRVIVGHLACAWELRALPSKEAFGSFTSAHTRLQNLELEYP
jgi:hypothetical protein